MVRFSCLCEKEVINICDGQRMGCVYDLEIDACGTVLALWVQSQGKLFSFAKEKRTRIAWDQIQRIGEDILLVAYQAPCKSDDCK